MTNYDVGNAPTSALPVKVSHELSITSFSRMNEINMNFELVFIERSIWTAPELAYESNSNIESKYKTAYINMNSVMSKVWIPKTQVTNVAKNEYRDESLLLYPNGTLQYTAYRHSVILCRMKLDKLPFDSND